MVTRQGKARQEKQERKKEVLLNILELIACLGIMLTPLALLLF